MSRVMRITGALAAVMLAAAPSAVAQVTPSQEPDASPWPTVGRDTTAAALADTAYIRQAIRGNYLEVALGRLAESRAADSAVKGFGERMISEHNSMNEQWATLARNNDMRVGLDVGPAGMQSIERLEDLSGAAFDQAYMAEMIRDHEQDLAAFRRMGASARSPEVRKLANSGMSSILEHLVLARQVGSRVGVSTTAGRTGDGAVPAPAPSDDDRRRTAADSATRDERDNRNDRNDRGTLRAEDRAFVQEVLQDHLMHLRLAERAQREARSDETRRLAERIEDDFKEWQERWEDVADRYDVKAPSKLGRLHGQKVEKLEQASKRNFDRTYAAIVAEHLASVVPYFQKEGQAVRSATVRRLVGDELPVLRKYLARARQLEGQVSARAEASDRE
jgi:putative membrane protein